MSFVLSVQCDHCDLSAPVLFEYFDGALEPIGLPTDWEQVGDRDNTEHWCPLKVAEVEWERAAARVWELSQGEQGQPYPDPLEEELPS